MKKCYLPGLRPRQKPFAAPLLLCFLLTASHLTAQDYYWVGGSGKWSEYTTHWAKIPNPVVATDFHANVPTAGNDVYFTGNASPFTAYVAGTAYTVNVDAGSTVPKCRNMDWSGVPAGTVWGGGGGRMDIYGSLTMDANMSMTFNNEIHFISNDAATKQIWSKTVHFSGPVYFEGTGGGWQYMDEIYFNTHMYHTNGLIETMGNKLTLDSQFQGFSPGKLDLGASEVIVNAGSDRSFFYAPSDFDAGTSHIIVTGNAIIHGTYAAYGNITPSHFYNVTFTASTGNFAYGSVDGTLKFIGFATIHSYGLPIAPTLNNVIFEDGALIYNAFNYKDLKLTAGKTYTIHNYGGTNGTDQTILPGGSLTALGAGNCSGFITIKSWQYGTPVNFVNNSGATQTVHCGILEDIHATGSSPLEVIDGVNLGNSNTGWIFTNPHGAMDLYWIGGDGDWNDPAHWSETDGGLAGMCIPNGATNVFFTALSGFSLGDKVNVQADVYCANMDWTGVTGMPEIYHPVDGLSTLHIYGSLTLDVAMDFNYGSPVRFRTSVVSTITSASHEFLNQVVFEGTGTWELQDIFKAPHYQVNHNRGTFKTLGNPMIVHYWYGNVKEDITPINMGAVLWLGISGGNSSTVSLAKSVYTNTKGTFRCWYEAGNFHAEHSHIIGEKGGFIDCQSSNYHDFWDVTFNPIDHAGDFLYGNILNKLTFLGGANLISTHLYDPSTNNYLHEAEFHQGGYIYGSNRFDHLTMAGGYSYKFQHDNTVQTITSGGSFNLLNGSCTAPIYLYNPIPGHKTTIRKEGAGSNFNIHDAIFDRVFADQTTGANYSATSSFAIQSDVEASWNISNPGARDLYWVGGDGTWNDPNHWSLNAGGAGGECPPTARDNVFFNNASGLGGGQAVTLNSRFSYCKNMDWTGVASGTLFNSTVTPSEPFSGNGLMIFGSLAFSPEMTNNTTGICWLRANGPATIKSAGQTFKNHLHFWSDEGNWTLLDELSTVPNSNVTILHWHGELTTNNHNIICGGWNLNYNYGWFDQFIQPSAKLNLGSSKLTVWAANAYNAQAHFYGYAAGNFDAGTSEIILEATGPGDVVVAGGYASFPPQVFHDITIKGTGGLYGGQVNGKLLLQNTGFVSDGGPIKTLEFQGDGSFVANYNYSRDVHSIRFAPGKRYTFSPTFTLNIVPHNGVEGQFIAQGLPGQYIEIKSSDPNTPAIIHKDDYDGTSTCTKYLFLTGMTHTGTEDIYVPTPGGNVFNNTGWQFFPCNPCPASIPVLDVANSITTGCPPGKAKLVLAGLKPDEWAIWYSDPAATTNIVYNGGQVGPMGNMFTPTITGPTTYYARVYSDGGLCESTVILSVDITITSPPAVFDVTGNVTGCQGLWAPVYLSGSEAGVTYDLLRDGIVVHSIISNNTGPLIFPSQTVSGSYTVVATRTNTACSATMNGSAIINLSNLNAPVVSITANSPLCTGSGSLILNESGGGSTGWSWTGPGGFTSMAQSPVIPNPTVADGGTYTVIATAANGCTNVASETIFINPSPVADPVSDITVCSGEEIPLITFTGSPGATFSWTNSNPAIGLAASGSTWILPFTAVNNGSTNITATITVHPQTIFCSGQDMTFQITVKPSPTVTIQNGYQDWCGGSAFFTQPITFSSNIPGSTFTWENPNTSIGLGPNGTGDIAPFWALGFSPNGNFTNIKVTPSPHNGCAGIPSFAYIEIRPFPEVGSIANQVVCRDAEVSIPAFVSNTPGSTYEWFNDNPSIGLPASGIGNIPDFVANNLSTDPVVANITIVPIGPNGCSGNLGGFTVTVLPRPLVDKIPNVKVCHGESVSAVVLGSYPPNTSYVWTNDNTAIGLGANGTGDIPAFMATNAGTTTIIGRLKAHAVYTYAATSCRSLDTTGTVTVYPLPTMSCPPNIFVTLNAPAFSLTGATPAGGDYIGPNVVNGNFDPSAAGLGNHPVTYGYTDGNGCDSECGFTVSVQSGNPPTIICPPNIVRNTDPGLCSAIVTYPQPSFTAEALPATLTLVSGPASGSTFLKGATMLNWEVADALGRVAVCDFTVTVNDNQAPNISCPANIVRNTDAGRCDAMVTYPTPTATDNCPGVMVMRTSPAGTASGSLFPTGTTPVAWEASDAATPVSNKKSCTFTVTVNDVQAPSISCPANLVKGTDPNACTAAVTYAEPSVADNCPGVMRSLQGGLPSGGLFPKGQTTVVWRATDGAGLTKTCSFRVTVNDAQVPSITCPASVVKDAVTNLCSATATYTTPTFSDNCGGGLVTRILGLASGSAFPVGTNVVVWRAIDASGLSKTCSFMVSVSDVQSPSITCPNSVTAPTDLDKCTAEVPYVNPVGTDNCAGAVTFLQVGLASGSVFPLGSTTVVWKVLDLAGLSNTCSFVVTVQDMQAPAITCPPSTTVNGGGSPCGYPAANLPGATAAPDNCSITTLTHNAPPTLSPGIHSIMWTASDVAGNVSPCLHTVMVNCPTAPSVGSGTMPAPNRFFQEQLGLHIAPNPANFVTTFTVSGLSGAGELTVFDPLGRTVWRQAVTGEQPQVQLEVSRQQLAAGVYQVRLQTEQGFVTKTLMVSRL